MATGGGYKVNIIHSDDSEEDSMEGISARFLSKAIPDVDVAAGGTDSNMKKMIFAETAQRYLENQNICKPVIHTILRQKLGPYASDIWFDSVYLKSKPRPSFLDAFKKAWVNLMDIDDYHKLIQRYDFGKERDAIELGQKFERDMQPYLSMAANLEVKLSAEKAGVARFRKILGGPLMARILNRHPGQFTAIHQMIEVIKDLNDELGITHQAEPAEIQCHVMAIQGKDQSTFLESDHNQKHTEEHVSDVSEDDQSQDGYLSDSADYHDGMEPSNNEDNVGSLEDIGYAVNDVEDPEEEFYEDGSPDDEEDNKYPMYYEQDYDGNEDGSDSEDEDE
jgi:hypothetical protein